MTWFAEEVGNGTVPVAWILWALGGLASVVGVSFRMLWTAFGAEHMKSEARFMELIAIQTQQLVDERERTEKCVTALVEVTNVLRGLGQQVNELTRQIEGMNR
jgi:hypothetical protein